jgi:hypothetical protein
MLSAVLTGCLYLDYSYEILFGVFLPIGAPYPPRTANAEAG